MNILALETSLPQASLCLSLGGKLSVCAQWVAQRNHDADLFPALQQAIDALGEAPLDYILVGAGPGSYGGVRVALAAAAGLALVTEATVVAVPSWQQLAEGNACVISDAKRGGWTVREPNGHIRVLNTDEVRELAASGRRIFSIETPEKLAPLSITIEKTSLIPTAEGLIHSWLALSPDQQNELSAKPAEPIYVRPPHITEAKHKPWEVRA